MILMPVNDMQIMFDILSEMIGLKFPKVKNLPRAACTLEQFEKIPAIQYVIDGKVYTLERDVWVYRGYYFN